MALPATHVRFALDLRERLAVTDLTKYLSGTIYPDSRYLTKLPREITHADSFSRPGFYQNDDFKKGWAVHLICDQLQHQAVTTLFAEQLKNLEPLADAFNHNWVFCTALKILQDSVDAEVITMSNYLKYLTYAQNPNGEKLELISNYNKMMADDYRKGLPSLEDNERIQHLLGFSDKTVKQLYNEVRRLGKEPRINDKLVQIYSRMIVEVNQFFS